MCAHRYLCARYLCVHVIHVWVAPMCTMGQISLRAVPFGRIDELGNRIRKTGSDMGEALWLGRGQVGCAVGSLQVVPGLLGQDGGFNV